MTKSTKLLSLFIAVVMLVTIIPFNAFAASKAPAKPTSLTATSTTTTATIKWKKVKGANGYQLYSYNTTKKKYTLVKTLTATSYKVSSLKAGTTYVYAVKAYKTVKKKKYYSGYSSKVTVSTLPKAASALKASAITYNSITVSWTKPTGATGYKVQYSTNSKFTSATTKTTTANSLKLTSLKQKTKYYIRVYAYRVVSKKTYTAAASSVINATTKEKYATTKSVVTESTTYQTVEGFGASGCWWAQKVGGWNNADDYLKLLYSKDDGIGLNIYRYNLGAGSDTDDKIDHGKSAETFLVEFDDKGNPVFDFTRDANAQNALALAKKYAGDDLKVTLFANSPPVQLTKNGKGYCYHYTDEYLGWINYNDLETNLSTDNYSAYSSYLLGIADHFEEKGYDVKDISPVNEPQYDWSTSVGGGMSQEGCHYSPAQAKSLFTTLSSSAKSKPYKISMFESCAADCELTENGQFDTGGWCKHTGGFAPYFKEITSTLNNRNYYDSVSLHTYWSDKAHKQITADYIKSVNPKMTVACTEYCQMTGDATNGITEWYPNIDENGNDNGWYDIMLGLKQLEGNINCVSIKPGVQLARVMHEDLTVLNATEWDWWTAVSGGYYPDGLVYYDIHNTPEVNEWDSTSKTAFTSKRLWCMGNYSKFIHSGAKRVKITEAQSSILSSAYKNTDGSIVIVYVNQNDSAKNVNINASGYKTYSVYTTSDAYDLENTKNGTYSYDNAVSIPAQSVVTVVLK